MSVDLEVALNRSDLPTVASWLEEIGRFGIPLTLPTDVTIERHSGYLPANLDGEDAGFEFHIGDPEPGGLPDSVKAELGTKDSVARFRFVEEGEAIAALVSAAALARLARGVIFDPSAEEILSPDQALTQAQEGWASLKSKRDALIRKGRTTAKWAVRFLEISRAIHPDYARSDCTKGRFIECVRRDESGLYVSQNCIRIRDTYHHCLGVMFSAQEAGHFLYYPFLAGGRFDHNFQIWRAFALDLGLKKGDPSCPKGLDSRHEWRTGAEEMIEKCCRNAEEYLLPFYRARLARGSDVLASLFSAAIEILNALQPETLDYSRRPDNADMVGRFASEFHLDPREFADWDEWLRRRCVLLATAQAVGLNARKALEHRGVCSNLKALEFAFPSKRLTAIPPKARNTSVVLNNLEAFLPVRKELPVFLETCSKLRCYREGNGLKRLWEAAIRTVRRTWS